MRISLFRRLFLLISLSVVAVILVLSSAFYLSARRIALDELQERGELLAEELATESAHPLQAGNQLQALEQLVKQLDHQHDVTLVTIEDPGGKTIAESGDVGSRALSFETLIEVSDEDLAAGTVGPTQAARPVLGRARVSLSLAGFQRRVRRIELEFVAIAVALTLLALLPAFLIARWLAGRIGAIAQAAAAVGEGDYSFRLAARDLDELGDLERGFNVMIEALGTARRELETKLAELTKTLSLLQQTQGQLLHSDKIAAVGQLAGGVAHDFNNLITVILFSSRALEDSLPPDDPRRSDLAEVIQAASRASDLTRQLLAFSRRQKLEPKVIDLNVAVAGMEKMLRRLIGENIQLVFERASDPLTVRIDPGQFEQVLLNLIVNARDALPKGGTVRVVIAPGAPSEGAGVIQRISDALSWVHVAVSDNGVGMSEETRAHIFEPFFTTKGMGKGTGLGLSTVHGIVDQSGGQLVVASTLGAGTTFTVYLPQVSASLAAPDVRPADNPGRQKQTILLVEDEEQVRQMAARILRKNGFEVLETGSPTQALKLADSCQPGVDLLLTDVVMPEMHGTELAGKLLFRHPTISVLYMSGYSDHPELDEASRDPGTFMPKPFTPEDLVRRVRDVLDAAARANARVASRSDLS